MALAAAPGRAADAGATAVADPWRQIAIEEDRRRPVQGGALERLLADPQPEIRVRAARAVGRLQDTTTVAALVPLLRDRDATVRREAAFGLGQIGHRSALDPLEAALADADPEVAELAIEALGKLGDRRATPRVAALLAHPSAARRSEAAVALWRLADSTALDALLAAHQDRDPGVRWRVLWALEKIVAPGRITLIAALHLSETDPLIRAYAARTIGRQKSPRGTAYLLQALGDPEVAVIVNALRALQQIGDTTCSACAPALVTALGHGHPYVRVTAAAALGDRFALVAADSAGRARALDALRDHLRDPDAATRGAAAAALLAHHGEAALPEVEPVLRDSSIYARVAALRGLAKLPAARTTPLLLAQLAPGAPLFERMTAAELLGAAHAREAVAPLRAALRDSALLVVAAAASALQDLGDSASVRPLARAYATHAKDADADARIALRDALRALGGARFADSLERAHPAPSPPAEEPLGFEKPPTERGAILHTTAGDIEWAFDGGEAPQTVKNFVRLAGRGYFDGLAVHRVVPNFVIQDGDPTGTGSGGPGYTIRCEYNRLRYDAGKVGMALSGKDTGGSQWFITHSPQPHLNGRYTIFAHVTRGLDVVGRIVQGDRILRVEILQ